MYCHNIDGIISKEFEFKYAICLNILISNKIGNSFLSKFCFTIQQSNGNWDHIDYLNSFDIRLTSAYQIHLTEYMNFD